MLPLIFRASVLSLFSPRKIVNHRIISTVGERSVTTGSRVVTISLTGENRGEDPKRDRQDGKIRNDRIVK